MEQRYFPAMGNLLTLKSMEISGHTAFHSVSLAEPIENKKEKEREFDSKKSVSYRNAPHRKTNFVRDFHSSRIPTA